MFQIKPVNFNNAKASNLQKTRAANTYASILPRQLNKDTVTFCGRIKNNDLLKLPEKEILNKINSSLQKCNFIGSGGSADVYRIPDTPYCIRILKKKKAETLGKSLNFSLSESDKINHVVAKSGNGSAIMRYIEGENCFAYQNKKEIVTLPSESYHRLFKQICHAKENNMVFDCDATNIIYNAKDKTLTAIDFYKMDKSYPENVNPLSSIFSALCSHKTDTFQDIQHNKLLVGALLKAGLKEMEYGVKPCISISEFDFNKLLLKFEAQNTEQLPAQYEFLKKSITDIQCLKLKELIGEDVKNELGGKIKFAKALIDQVLCESRNSNFKNVVLWQ